MCGRATLTTPVEQIAETFGVGPIDIGPARYNVAPGQPIVVVRQGREADELALLKWGLLPWWSKTEKTKKPLVQARAETVATTPAFRDAFQARRCLVVVDGFYEWKTEGTERIPHHVHMADRALFAIAGVWDSWKSQEGARIETCAVVTTEAHGVVRTLHDRMPLVLEGTDREIWLHGSAGDASALVANAARSQEDVAKRLVVLPVSKWVNDVRHEDPRCLDAVGTDPGQLGFKLF